MSATPGARNEYSRGSGGSDGVSGGPSEGLGPGGGRPFELPSDASGGGARGLILAGSLLGALLLVVSQFTTLYVERIATSPTTVRSFGTGANHDYALVPIAVLAGFLGVGVFRAGARPALLAIGILGLVALLIALLGDLPGAHGTGLVGSASTHYYNASSSPRVGLYMETLGALVLIAACGLGFLMLGPPPRRRASRDAPRARGG